MVDLKQFRRDWSANQKELRTLLSSGNKLEQAKEKFILQHEVLHSLRIAEKSNWSFADDVFSNLSESQLRIIPPKEEHSLIWILWHISRIEDITLNILVDEGDQLYLERGWKEKIGSEIHYAGNMISTRDLDALNSSVYPSQLFFYRDAVGKRTREIVAGLTPERCNQKVSPQGLERLVEEGAVLPESEELLDYWGKRKIYQLLLMPPTRHLLVHLNEANRLVKKII
jgi:hypothetical protein